MGAMQDNYTRYPRAVLWLVRGGEATIGGDGDDDRPAFPVEVEPFYLSKVPVTNLQYEAFDPDHARAAASPGDDDPATGVDFDGARGYCEWYARVSRKPMRLPTEVEWEYACRGGTATRYFFGDDPSAADAHVPHAGNCGETLPALNRTQTNPFGLHAMLGGVWEWTSSRYLPYPASPGDDRDIPGGDVRRVMRGGSFRTAIEEIGSAVRRACEPDFRADDVGFRVARSLR